MPTVATMDARRFWQASSITLWATQGTAAIRNRWVVAGAGVQLVTPGTIPAEPVLLGTFSVTQEGDPADKLGKDTDFRGLAVFNNTLYVTKGIGSNGINTVYQLGTAGALPNASNSTLPVQMNILPGFPTTLAKNAGAIYPFWPLVRERQ